MKNDKQVLFPGLFDEVYQAKAFIKYDIKQTEVRFQKEVMQGWQNSPSQRQSALEFSTALIKLYRELLGILNADNQIKITSLSFQYENNLVSCYIKIQQVKQKLMGILLLKTEIELVAELVFFYQNLKSLLSIPTKALKPVESSKNIFLKKLIQVVTTEEWLLALVKFANETGNNIDYYQEQLSSLSTDDLLIIDKKLMAQDFIALHNSIFFFKINPNELYPQTIHPEKLISVKTRLKFLYHFIELLQYFSSQLLKQRGLRDKHDYLFHGEEIPAGINIQIKSEHKDLIRQAIKTWRLNHLNLFSESVPEQLSEIFRAYKFWFNPISLIDSIMNFYTKANTTKTLAGSKGLFLNQLNMLYQQLTTTDCLNLYGYFSNKDTNYLMRTLLASYQGYKILPRTLLPAEKEAVLTVYTVLNLVMNTLREELKNRHIVTDPYDHDIKTKTLTPGRRNLQALQRVLDIYCEPSTVQMTNLEQLFAKLEE
ncbi:hypothetical protein ACNVED_01980 [Legionella sp. D16C41]|uniref:hypothetical protein n=1 Tax=Legionella sp. D16C41 TaxID=3402688 RepID=UPI003AF62A73